MKKFLLLLLTLTTFVPGASSRTITLQNNWISTVAVDHPDKGRTDLLPAGNKTELTFDNSETTVELRHHILGTYGDYTAEGLTPTTTLNEETLNQFFPGTNEIIIDPALALRTPRQRKQTQRGTLKKGKTLKGLKNAAFLIIDVQADFMQLPVKDKDGKMQQQGSLAVAHTGKPYLKACQELIDSKSYPQAATKDFHPRKHISFASRWNKEPFTEIEIEEPGITKRIQMLWPDHCVQGTPGAEILLKMAPGSIVVPKGTDPNNDSYSGFKDDGGQETPLKSLLKKKGIKTLIVIGIATDYCVRASVLHALAAGFKVIVITNLCRGVRLPGDESVIPAASLAAFKEMQDHGAKLYFLNYLDDGTPHQEWLKALKDAGLTIQEIE